MTTVLFTYKARLNDDLAQVVIFHYYNQINLQTSVITMVQGYYISDGKVCISNFSLTIFYNTARKFVRL